MSFEYGFFDELEKIAEGPKAREIFGEAMKRVPLTTEVAGPYSPLTTGAAYKAGLSRGRAQMKEAVRGLKDKRPFFAHPAAAAAAGAGGAILLSRLLSRKDE